MPDKKVSDLTAASTIQSEDLFVLEQSGAAKKLTGQTLVTDLAAALDGHGGISSITWSTSGTSGNGQTHTGTIHYADGTTSTVEIKDGYKGSDGVGVPSGGTTGQVLAKSSNSNYATTWTTPAAASTAIPNMDGAASAGTHTAYAREDHIHPSDTSRYVKPSGGIPASDLADDVQSSLGLADTALQSINDVVFWATYGETSAASIEEAIQAEKTVICKRTDNENINMPLTERVSSTSFRFGGVRDTTDGHAIAYTAKLDNGTWTSADVTLPSLAEVHSLPSGGASGQILKKSSNIDYSANWADEKTEVFWATYGTTSHTDFPANLGQNTIVACKRNFNNYFLTSQDSREEVVAGGGTNLIETYYFTSVQYDGDVDYVYLMVTFINRSLVNYTETWGNGTVSAPHGIPHGGSPGQVLRKPAQTTQHDTGYEAEWSTIHAIPVGGVTGQVLKKASNTDYDVTWGDGGGGGGGGTSDYTDLSNKPSINSVTLSGNKTASDLGLGTYSKPSGGIPKTDLASSVQTSLGKADSALQSAPVSSVDGKTGAVTVLPSGGSSGQVLKKTSGTDYDVEWANESGGGGSSPSPYTSNPAALGTASPGSSDDYARGDHVHPIPFIPVAGNSNPEPLGTASPGVSLYYACADHVHPKPTASDLGITVPSAATATPANLGTAAVGSSSKYAKEDHVHAMPTAANVGAIAAPSSPSVGDFLVYTSNGWAAQSLSTWQGGSY